MNSEKKSNVAFNSREKKAEYRPVQGRESNRQPSSPKRLNPSVLHSQHKSKAKINPPNLSYHYRTSKTASCLGTEGEPKDPVPKKLQPEFSHH